MELKNVKVGLGITGSFCNFDKTEGVIDSILAEGVQTIIPVISNVVRTETTRFYDRDLFLKMLHNKTGNDIVDTIVKAEPVGPNNLIDVMIICPCTGNTLAKLANGITDTPVLMVTKSHLRNNKPVVIGLSTNDALGLNLKNLATLMNTKNVYFIPYEQDNYLNKPKSLSLNYSKIIDTVKSAMDGVQIQPVLSK